MMFKFYFKKRQKQLINNIFLYSEWTEDRK